MKKFYTLAMAALLCAGFASARSLELLPEKAQLSETNPTVKLDKKNLVKVAPMRVTSDDVSGDYVTVGIDAFEEDHPVICGGSITVAPGIMEGQVSIYHLLAGFVGMETKKVNANIQEVVFSDGETAEVITIKGEGKNTLFTSDKVNYKIWLMSYGNNFYRYPNDIDIIVAEDGLYMPGYTVDDDPDAIFGIGFLNDEGRGNLFGAPDFRIANAKMEAKMVTGVDEAAQEYIFTDVEYPMYFAQYEEGGETLFYNFAEAEFPIAFDIDAEAGEMVAVDQVFAIISGYEDFYPTNVEGEPLLICDYAEYDGYAEATIPGGWMVTNVDDVLYTMFGETTITIGNKEEGGIADSMIDNSNAPVVYYNLQGMKVANPEAGHIYIVKQGNKATKQVIR